MDIAATLERELILLVRTIVGVLVAVGSLIGLYVWFGRVAAVLSVIFTIGVLHLVIEFKHSRKGGQDTRT